jgi:hypothetical protein
MGRLSFVRRHSTLAVFTASLTTSAFFVACGDDDNGGNVPTEAGTGGDKGAGGGASGGSAGKGAGGGTAGKGNGGSGGGTAGAGGKAVGGSGGAAGSGGKGNIPDAQPDVISSNGDAAADGDVPDSN